MKKGIILNAEAFGFGPSSAIAQIFNEIRSHFEFVAYIGEGHTHDLQKNLPYNEIIVIKKNQTEEELLNILKLKTKQYQYFLSAIDFRYAKIAKKAGFKTALYDPLTWFWKNLPLEIKNLDLYISQNFYNTKDVIKNNKNSFPINTQIVAPITIPFTKKDNSITLVNLGGLSNPHLNDKDLAKFANICANSLGENDKNSKIVTSLKIANLLNTKAETASPELVHSYLSQSKLAIMACGLGNIFEAASSNTVTLWLPPTNDSQGQQLEILQRNGFIDESIHWHDFIPSSPIDYFKDQIVVIKEIKEKLDLLNRNKKYQIHLKKLIQNKIKNIENQSESKLCLLLTKYGHSGIKEISGIIKEWAK